MQRRKTSAPYEVPAVRVSSAAAATGDSFSRPRHPDKTSEFLDLRVDLHERATKSSAAKSILGVSKAPLLPSKTSTKPASNGIAFQPTLALMMPSATPNGLKRCQSASTIRKKLQHAMDQSAQSYPEQIAALRSLSTTSITKPTPKMLLLNQRTHGGPVSASSHSLMSTAASEGSAHTYGSQPRSVGETVYAAAAKPKYATMFAEPTTTNSMGLKRPSSAAAGAYKSNTIELEVQLAERLNEIERSKLSEKAESRFRASQRAFDHVIQQDEGFGRILASIRDEYESFIAFLTHDNRTTAGGAVAAGCRCRHDQHVDNQSRESGIDAANVRQENAVLKKSCSSMQREIEVLRASILAASIQRGTGNKSFTKAPSQPEDDSASDEDELGDVLLLPLVDAMHKDDRPSMIPPLDFSCLSPYNEEEEEFDEADEEF